MSEAKLKARREQLHRILHRRELEATRKLTERVGVNLRRLRSKSGLSQEHLGRLAGFPSNTVSRIERGMAKLSLGRLSLLATCLNVRLSELVDPSVLRKGTHEQDQETNDADSRR